MPTRALLPSIFTHSWSLVYLRSAGYMSLRSLVERHRHDRRLRAAAADVDLEFGARRRAAGREIRHADRLLQVRRLRPAGHDAGLFAANVDIVAVAADRALEHLETHELARRPFRFLPLQHVGSEERILL